MINIKKILLILLVSLLFISKVNAKIEDALFITIGNKAVTKLDILNEMKIILILNNQSYSEDKREMLHDLAIKSIIKRTVKQIEIEKNDFLQFNVRDLENELVNLATNINVDLETLKNICESNALDFSLIESQMKTELLWNSLIFHFYKNRLSVNTSEIDEQLQAIQNKKEYTEYLISEIIFKPQNQDDLNSEIKKIKSKIETEGFEKVAKDISLSESAVKGGDLGWLSEDIISKKYLTKINKTQVGNISEPILLQEGVLIFKLRDKRNKERKLDLEEKLSL